MKPMRSLAIAVAAQHLLISTVLAWPAVTTANVNLRKGPGTNQQILRTLPDGSLVEVGKCDDSGTWCAVTIDQITGFMSGRYLKEIAPSDVRTQTSDAAQPKNAEADIGWPREVATEIGPIVIYQPQLDNLEGPVLTGRAAFSWRKGESDEPEFGAAWFTSNAEVDNEERLVYITGSKITKVGLEGASKEEISALQKALNDNATGGGLTLDLDRFIAALNEADVARQDAEGLNTDPPKIIISNVPAVLVFIDGEPKMQPVPDTDMFSVENTPFPIVLDPQSKLYYLNGGPIWYQAPEALGPYKHVEKVPDRISALIQLTDEQKADLAKEIGLVEGDKDDRIPAIIVATEPTELIVIDGEPSFTPLVGADLLYVENTETGLFLDPSSKLYYAVLSGRWYSSKTLGEDGWSYVPGDELPAAFAQIPEDSERGEALTHVPGTLQAEEAITEASIPQVSAISRTATIEVSYDGDPQFETIEGTNIEIAVNTDVTVLRIDGIYYAVDQGVWYVSDNATGPWAVADEVPSAVEDIPPQSPAYNVKYVKVYDSTPEYVYVGYTPGYLGSYIYRGVVWYGTGYYYRPWFGRYYYPRPLTWGFGAYYSPWYGWSYGVGWGRFHYAAGFTAGLITSAIWRNHRRNWYGPGGYHSRRYDNYRRKYHRADHYRNRNNLYDRPRNRDRNQFKDRPRNRDFEARYNGKNRKELANRKNMRPKGDRANNVFADKNGKIYRQNKDGSWNRRDGKKWEKANFERPGGERPATRPAQRPAAKTPAVQRPAAKKPAAKKQAARKSAAQKRAKPRNVQSQAKARNRGNQRTASRKSSRSAPKYKPKSSRGGSRRGGSGRRRR